MERVYACIDLKSFYASVEAVERGLDPFKVNLVVADESRGKGAITLAITPAMKKLGVKNRCRLFQIPEGIDYIIAKPRMNLYMEYSAFIYGIYLDYFCKNHIHIYSIDECFFDMTPYLELYRKEPIEILKEVIGEVYRRTGICATGGLGTNLFLAKVAMDIISKRVPDNIGVLDRKSFYEHLSEYEPITDIWGIGQGIATTLAGIGITNLKGIREADCELMYKLFGINAELLIDHAKGIETCTMKDIKRYTSSSHSVSNSQILFEDYNYSDAWTVIKEMIDNLLLEMVPFDLKSDNISLSVGYSGEVRKRTGGSRKLPFYTNSYKVLETAFKNLFRDTVSYEHPIKKLGISFNNVKHISRLQLHLFDEYKDDADENRVQKTVADIKVKFGKNSIMRCNSLKKKATGMLRNKLIGGHNGW